MSGFVVVCLGGPPLGVVEPEPVGVNLDRVAVPVLVKGQRRVVVQMALTERNAIITVESV